MKKIMLALAMFGFTAISAQTQAQTCKTAHKAKMHRVARVTHHTTTNNLASNKYQVCRQQNGYYTCCVYNNTSNTTLLK